LFNADAALVATWHNVEPIGGSRGFNTFQLIVVYNQITTWVIFSYQELQWFDSSEFGSVVGYNDGLGVQGRLIRKVKSKADMDYLLDNSNVGLNGVFAYEMGSAPPVPVGCGQDSIPQIVPFAGPKWGGTVIHIQVSLN